MAEQRIEKRAVTKQEAAEALSVSIDILERLIAEKRIHVLKLGVGRSSRVIVPVWSLDEFVESSVETGDFDWLEASDRTERGRSTSVRRMRSG